MEAVESEHRHAGLGVDDVLDCDEAEWCEREAASYSFFEVPAGQVPRSPALSLMCFNRMCMKEHLGN